MATSVMQRRPLVDGHEPDGDVRDAALLRALRAAAFAGTWIWDVARDAVILDHGAAALITGGGLPEGGALTVEGLLACAHPDDREWLRARIRLKGARVGPVELHYRVRWPMVETRAVQGRGTIELAPGGAVIGRGILTDLTGRDVDAALRESDSRLRLYDATIDHALLLRDAVRRLDGEPSVTLVDTLLLSLCEDAAGELEPAETRRRH